MKVRVAVAAMCITLLAGCSGKEEEMQKQITQLQGDDSTLQQNLAERDKFVGDIIQSINDVYANLEQARLKEGQLAKRAGSAEGPAQLANMETRQKLLQDIGDIGSALKDDQKKIALLQSRSKAMHNQMASLNTLIGNLKSTLQEREESINQLQAKVEGLESTVAENTKTITEKEGVIDDQQRQLNTTYYVVGTKDELRKKGVITDEGGFLWGLLGSTTTMAANADPTAFTPIDKTKEQAIHVTGKIDEILPKRSPETFQENDTRSDLTILSPDRFWQDKYLVIVVGG